MGKKHSGKRRNCSLRAISPFPTVFSKGVFSRGVKGVIVWKWVKQIKSFDPMSACADCAGWHGSILFANKLTISLLLTAQEAFVDGVDQDQTARSVQSDL